MKNTIVARRRLLEWLGERALEDIEKIAGRMSKALKAGGAIYACGNGGSASQAEHFAAELLGRFKQDRSSLPVFALSANSTAVTALSNDYGFEEVYARQLRGIGRAGDCLLALSTSGTSENIVRACREAKRRGMAVFALTGRRGGPVASESELTLQVPDNDTARIQEVHLVAVHLICEMVEKSVFSPEPTRPENV